jgi:hypothetical protein
MIWGVDPSVGGLVVALARFAIAGGKFLRTAFD